MKAVKILQIGNYPPPMCGWAIQLKMVTEELRRRGHVCDVLKINEGRQVRSGEYVDVQSGADYLRKIVSYAARGFRLNPHVNACSKKGYLLALAAAVVGRVFRRPARLTFHGGLSQYYFPRSKKDAAYRAFQLLFQLSGSIACDDGTVKRAIQGYGVPSWKIETIATFSEQYTAFAPTALPPAAEQFLLQRERCFVSYVSFRPEYELEFLREAMQQYSRMHPGTGFVWLGFPEKELGEARQFIAQWSAEERENVVLLGNLSHDEFLSLVQRCYACIRTPACDGVAASVLEAIALGVPVVASENGGRPPGVITYSSGDARDLCAKLEYLTDHYQEVRDRLQIEAGEDNVGKMADWLTGELPIDFQPKIAMAGESS